MVKTVGELAFCKKKNKGVMPELSGNCHLHSDLNKRIKRTVVKRVVRDETLPCDNLSDEVERLRHLLRRVDKKNANLMDVIFGMREAGAVVIKAADAVLRVE